LTNYLDGLVVNYKRELFGQFPEDWSIYYQEGIDFDTIMGVVFSIFLLTSLFGVLSTVLELWISRVLLV
jgi:hypothetical protein